MLDSAIKLAENIPDNSYVVMMSCEFTVLQWTRVDNVLDLRTKIFRTIFFRFVLPDIFKSSTELLGGINIARLQRTNRESNKIWLRLSSPWTAWCASHIFDVVSINPIAVSIQVINAIIQQVDMKHRNKRYRMRAPIYFQVNK